MSPRLSDVWARLDVARKWILFSAALVALSTVMPWYADLDAFGAGDLFLGLTGPLFLVGLLMLGSAVFTLAWILLPLFDKRLPRLPFSEGTMYLFLGFQDLVLLLIANSVFFHPKFGVNITLKETGFGMIVAFVGVALYLWSSYRLYKRAGRPVTSFEELEEPKEQAREPVMRPQPSLQRPMERPLQRPLTNNASPYLRREPNERKVETEEDRPGPQPLRMDL
jgi:hypothetical protein